ncbi:ZIM-domain protein 5 [Artemisia annua]|uniref:Protein TIFY n=1 Tax=Artemisia annua TaxID=35608 RepID=A0A2U1P692_ARTAN|nr:ZIM-domain protein 5 [Artemisia annua]
MSETVDSGDTKSNKFSQTCNLFTQFLNTTSFQHLTPAGGDRMNNIIFNKQDDTPASAQMTIFYGGQVIVVNDFPADKALEIMNMLSGTQTASSFVASDLPMARKASLARFLEKRKERITARAPYKQQEGTSTPSKQQDESNTWFGLEAESSGAQ